jgi:hypothetical protein
MSVVRTVPTIALALLLATACKSKSPVVASLTGPTNGPPGTALDFQVTGEDPSGRDLSYEADWDDTSSLVWSAPYPSGKKVTLQHLFSDTGLFQVRAKARSGPSVESAWSDSLQVHIQGAPVQLAKPCVTYEAIDLGARLRLTWTGIVDAKSYEITTDDSIFTTTSTSFDVTTPTGLIDVRAVNGSDKSDPATIDCGIVETASIDVYGISESDTTLHAGFAFTSDGNIVTYSLAYVNLAGLDFYADDVAFPGSMYLINPGDKGWNAKGNAVKDAGTTVYDDAKLADAPGTGYITQLAIVTGGVYYLWLDHTNHGWSSDDNFAKVRVILISGTLVTIQVGYQKVGGLRWLVD